MSKIKNFNPDLEKSPEYPVVEGYLFIVPNQAHSCKEDSSDDWNNKEAKNRANMFGEDLAYKPFVEIWAHNAPVEGSDSNWTDHGIPRSVQEKANIKFSRGKTWRDGLFFNRIPYEWVKGKNDGDHIYLEYEDDDGHKAYFDMICDQGNYRYRSHGDFQSVVKTVMARGGFAL